MSGSIPSPSAVLSWLRAQADPWGLLLYPGNQVRPASCLAAGPGLSRRIESLSPTPEPLNQQVLLEVSFCVHLSVPLCLPLRLSFSSPPRLPYLPTRHVLLPGTSFPILQPPTMSPSSFSSWLSRDVLSSRKPSVTSRLVSRHLPPGLPHPSPAHSWVVTGDRSVSLSLDCEP